MLLGMWRAAKKNVQPGLLIDVFAADEHPEANSAAATVTVARAASGFMPGVLLLYIAGQRLQVGVGLADTAATAHAKMVAAVNAVPSLPVTAALAGAGSAVSLTAKWTGETGNHIDVRSAYYPEDQLPVGWTVAVVGMAGGTSTASPDMLIAAMQNYRATEIACGFTDSNSLRVLEDELATRWQANNMQDGAVVTSVRGSEGQVTAWLATRNSPHVHTIATTGDLTSPWETAAMAGAAIESLAAIDPAVPHTGIKLIGYQGPCPCDGYTAEQVGNLLASGASPLHIAQDYGGALLRMVTNYTQTDSGAADRSMAELCWIKTMSYFRWFRVTDFQTKYQGFKLAQYITDPIPGQKIMTKELGEEVCLGQYKLFMDAGLMQNMPYYQETLLVEVDGPNGKLKIQDEPVIVTQHYQTEVTSFVVAGQV
jgi:phage tail sheath gpL-like